MHTIPAILSIRRRCELLGLNRSTEYYEEKPMDIHDVEVLNAIRDVWERHTFYGYRRITKELQSTGLIVNHKRVQRLMLAGGICAIYPGPNTSKRNHREAVYPYLLRNLQIERANEAWMVDITYLRLSGGFMYLVALLIYSRYVVSWALSNTMETAFCMEALRSGLKIAIPDIINSDQGSQFTSLEWINFLQNQGIQISMTGKGRCLDNIYIERFWRSFKREEFYLNDYGNVRELRNAICSYIEFYNHRRWHQSLNYKRPADLYVKAGQNRNPVDMGMSPTDQPVPFGTCGQTLDNANALPTPTLTGFSSTYPQAVTTGF